MQGWISAITDFGIRRAGGQAEAATVAFAQTVLGALGVEVRTQDVPLTRWDTREGDTTVQVCVGSTCAQYAAFPSLSSRVTTTLQGELVRYQGSGTAVAGRVVLLDYPMGRFAPGALQQGADWVYDPDGNINRTVHPSSRPQNSSAADTLDAVLRARPAAVIAALDDFIDTPYVYGVHSTVPYDRGIPIVWVSPSSRRAILAQLQGGAASARVAVVSGQSATVARNVIGRLPSDRSDQIMLIGSHHDAPFFGATEDAAGTALVLAQATYWSQVPRAERPFEFLFLLNTGHMLGSLGCEAFVAANAALLPRVVLDVHLETPCQEFDIDADGRLIDQGRIEPHWFYTSRNPTLQAALRAAVQAEDYRRTMMVPPEAFRDGPPSDAKALWKAGVPVMSHISNPVYYTSIADTLDKVNPASLEQLTRLTARTLWSLQGISAAQMRAGIVPR
jgi:Peptidase family M28